MSTNDDLIIILPQVIKILSQYFLTFLVIVGNLSCFLSLLVLLQKTMRKNPSGLYFLSFTLCNTVFINLFILDTILYFGFGVDPTANNLHLCRIHFYVAFVSSALSCSYLVLASADRYIITSPNDSIRRFSTRTMAKKLIVIVTVFWLLVHLHPFFLMSQPNSTEHRLGCQPQSKTYALVIIWYDLIIFGFLAPILWIFFGIRTITNVRRVLVSPFSRLYAIDRELIIIMLSQCFLFVLCRLPLPITLIYTHIARRAPNDPYYHTITSFLLYITLIAFYIPYCTFFFVNLISKSFRDDFKLALKYLVRRYILQKKKPVRRAKKHRDIRVYPLEIIRNNRTPVEPVQQ